MKDHQGKRREATAEERLAILVDHAKGTSYHQIAKKYPVSDRGAQKIVKHYETTGRLEPDKRSGRPLKLNERDIRHLERLSEADPFAPLAEIAATSQLNISVETVGRTLRGKGFYVRIARKTPLMNKKTREKRKKYAKLYQHRERAFWQRKLYTDEVRLEIGFRTKREGVRRRPNTALQPNHMVPTLPGDRTTVNFYGIITHGANLLVPIRQRTSNERESKNDKLGFNGTQYRNEILPNHLEPFLKDQEELHGQEILVIEDGHGAHRAKESRELRVEFGVKNLDFPPYSPDLNPIENVWGMWKSALRQRWRNPGNRPHGREEVIAQAQMVWENLPWKKIYRMIDRLPDRLDSVIRHKGWPTKW